MNGRRIVLLLVVTILLIASSCTEKGSSASKDKQLGDTKNTDNESVADGKKSETGNSQDSGRNDAGALDVYRVVPAFATVLIFIGGSIIIFVFEKRKEDKKKQQEWDQIGETEDDQMNAEWLATVARRKQRRMTTVFDKVRKFSVNQFLMHGTDSKDTEKERKYKIYDEMLEKYRETLRVLRKGAKPTISTENGERPAARLKKLAELHQRKISVEHTAGEDKVDEKGGSAGGLDQYTLTLQMLQEQAAADEIHEEGNQNEHDNEEPEIDPAYLHRRRRSSRFRKQAMIEEDGSFEKQSLTDIAALSQSYVASQVNLTNAQVTAQSSQNNDNDTELEEVLEKITPEEISALNRIQVRMRPKSFIENLAAIHRESIKTSQAFSMTELSRIGEKGPRFSDIRRKSESAVKLQSTRDGKETIKQGHDQKGSDTWEQDEQEDSERDKQQQSEATQAPWRGKQRLRRRPKSLYETGAVIKRINQGKKPRTRPASLHIQHRIQAAIPESLSPRDTCFPVATSISIDQLAGRATSAEQIIEIGSIHDIPFSTMTADEEETVIAEIEKQLIAQVCDENDLSTDEIKALESLLEDVVTYNPKDPHESKPKVSKQYSFADSISMFGDKEEEQMSDPDESEETVLMSLRDPSTSTGKNRMSMSTYDNA